MTSNDDKNLKNWIELVHKWKVSGQTQAEFCKSEDINLKKFRKYSQLIPLSKQLESLPDETDRNFAFTARQVTESLDAPINKFSKIIGDPVFSEKSRFNALYCSLAFLWQQRDFQHYRQLVDRYENEFSGHVMLLPFRSQYYSSRGKNVATLRLALEYASKAKERAPGLPNVLHLFASIIVDLADVTARGLEKELFFEAEDSINKAIAIVDGKYARYYATKADLLGKVGRFGEAKDLIQKAIEIEPSGQNGYALRIGDYQQIRLKIQFLEHSQLLQLKQKESIDKLEEVRLRVIELLGILSAIIAFLVTSIQIGKGFIFQEAARLMVISGGVILIIFSSYSVIFFRGKPRASQLIVLLFGAAIVTIFIFSSELIQFAKEFIL